ncbi:MAG: hypothetical protein Kow00109_13710 [Acidobacteriota bacterium]
MMNERIPRRSFLRRSIAGVGAAWGAAHAGGPLRGTTLENPIIAFNTANLVARVTGYRFELANWMEQHRKTVAATDAEEWRKICGEIAAAGFHAVEIWEAHASPESLDERKAAEWRKILEAAGLRPIAYAGRLRAETARVCQWLEIPQIAGGLGELDPEAATRLCEETGIRFNYENHPEKSADEILSKIGGGNEWLGVCIDTGWLATQGAPGPDVIRRCGKLVRHTHIKDVKAVGGHATCLLGEGVARVEECLRALREIGYSGVYSWEDEPEDRNPLADAVRVRRWLEERLQELGVRS